MRIQLPFGVPYEIVGHRPGQPVKRDESNNNPAPTARDFLPFKLRRVARPAWANENNFRAAARTAAPAAMPALQRETISTNTPTRSASTAVNHAAEQVVERTAEHADVHVIEHAPEQADARTPIHTPEHTDVHTTAHAAEHEEVSVAAHTPVTAHTPSDISNPIAEHQITYAPAEQSLVQNFEALAKWIDDGPMVERNERRDIAEVIAQCWISSRATKLKIHGKNLISSLPPLPPRLTDLEVWGCARITTPPVIAGHPRLQNLSFVACGSLQTIPDASHCKQLKSYTVQDCDGIVDPQDLSGCSKLTEVGYSGCRNLRALPNMSACPELEWLDLSDCKNLAGPVDLSANPRMKTLMMSGCHSVTALELDGCERLDTIFLQDCPALTTLPRLGHLQNLESLQMQDTPFTSLPDDIVSLPSTCQIQLDASRLSDAVRNRLAHVMNAPDYAGPQIQYSMGQAPSAIEARPVGEEVDAWRAEAPPHLQQALTGFDWHALPAHDNVKAFATFLVRVRETSDYRHGSPELKAATQQRMAALLVQMQSDPTLRENCFNLATDAVDTCGDRVALRMLDMDNLAVVSEAKTALAAGKYDQNPQALIDLCKGQHRLAIIATEAENKVATMHFTDSVEVHLGYLVKLAETYQLPVRISTMLYPACSGITDNDIAAVSKKLASDGSTAEQSAANDQAYQHALAGSELMRGLLHRLQPAQMQAANADNAKLIEQAKNTLHEALDALNPDDADFMQKNRQLMATFKAIEADIPIRATLPVLQNFLQTRGFEGGLGNTVSMPVAQR